MNELAINIKEAIPLLTSYITRGIPFILISQPGLGKTSLVKMLAKKLDFVYRGMFTVDKTPSDLNGYLLNKEGILDFHPFGLLKEMLTADKNMLVFFDEFTKAPGAVISAISQIVLDRTINMKAIPNCVTFALAANRKGDLSGDNPLPEHLKSRARIVNLKFDLPSFNEYMISNDFDESVIAFCNIYSTILENFQPSRNEEPSMVPRNMESLSNDIKAFDAANIPIKPHMLFPLLTAEYTYKFIELREILNSLPDLDEISSGKNPSISNLSPSACNLILVKLLKKIDVSSYDNIFKWVISNLRIEQQTLFFELCKVNHSKYLANSSVFVQWNIVNKGFNF